MQQAIPGQANTVRYDVVNKTTTDPITSGVVTAYLRCSEGAQAGKYWDAAGGVWSDTEVSAGAMQPAGGSSWAVQIAAEAWLAGCSYDLYAVESGNLNLLYTEYIVTWSAPTTGKGGPGWTYTLTDSSTGLPISGAAVWATTDAAGLNIVAYDTTNESGQVTFYISDGTYYIWRQKVGYTFDDPDQEVVS
ncbi:MAG TPA: hypothetical protein PKO46_21010 [Sedimentisphaerales bacterium]|nr:hypothetical protein [Sedimentisphaerales bacterium]